MRCVSLWFRCNWNSGSFNLLQPTHPAKVALRLNGDLLSQAATHIINVARLTNVSPDTLMQLFVFESNFGTRSQQTLEGMSEPFRAGWREIFTGKGMRINEAKYISIRKAIMPLLIYEKKNKTANAMPITLGSMTHLSTSLAGVPTASAVPAAPLKRKSDFANYFSAGAEELGRCELGNELALHESVRFGQCRNDFCTHLYSTARPDAPKETSGEVRTTSRRTSQGGICNGVPKRP